MKFKNLKILNDDGDVLHCSLNYSIMYQFRPKATETNFNLTMQMFIVIENFLHVY